MAIRTQSGNAPTPLLQFQTRVETWTGTIDSIDTRPAGSRRYNRYILSGHFVSSVVVATEAETTEQANELQAAAEEAEAIEKDKNNRRVILRDHDRLPLAHVGAIVKVVVQTLPPNHRFDIAEYDILYCIFLRSPHSINKLFISKAVCSSVGLCYTRREILAATDRKTAAKVRDVPTPPAYVPVVADIAARDHFNMAMMRRDDKPEVTRLIMIGFESLFALSAIGIGTHVTDALRRATERPLSISSYVVHALSAEDLRMHCDGLLRSEHVRRVFAFTTPEILDVCAEPLHARVWLRPQFLSSTQIIRSSDSLDHFHAAVPPKNYASGSLATELTRMIKQLGGGQFNKVESRVNLHTTVCIAAMRFGHTKFTCMDIEGAVELVRLKVWILADANLPTKITDKTPIVVTEKTMFTTEMLRARKSQIVNILDQYTHVGLISIDGGYADLSETDYESIVPLGALVVAPNAAGCEFGDYLDKKIISLDEVFEGRSWKVRAHAGIAPTLVLLDAHFVGERDLLLLLTIYRRLQLALQPDVKSKVVFVGDRGQYPASGGGCPFSDLYNSGSFATVECYASNVTESRDRPPPLQRLAALARYSPIAALNFADEFIRRRGERARDITAALDNMKVQKPWILIGNGAASMKEFLHAIFLLLRERTATNDGYELDQLDRRRSMIDALEFVSKNPVALTSSVLMFAPFILYEGYIVRIVNAFQQTRVEQPDVALGTEDCTLISPYKNGLVSLDARALVLGLESSPVDHRICCGTKSPNLMRVSVHRRHIRGASIMLARDAASRVALANDAIFSCAHPRHLGSLSWNDVCAVIPRFVGNIDVLIPKQMGPSEEIFRALHSVCRRVKTAPRTLFQFRQHLHELADRNY
jgi:hypothetical protein